jgi:ComF family protein
MFSDFLNKELNMRIIKKYLEALRNVFFPALCFCCERKIEEGFLCGSCFEKIEFLYPPLCRGCSTPIKDNKTGLCKNCKKEFFYYERVISATTYKEPISLLLHLFKYRHFDYLGEFLSLLVVRYLIRVGFEFSDYDFITCVPLHPAKEKERGYNQSAIISKIISFHFKIPFKSDIIYQTRLNPSQTKLSKEKREINIKDSFKVKGDLEGKRIILVDDVFTTGSTVKECCRVLKEKGANITVLTLSKTL